LIVSVFDVNVHVLIPAVPLRRIVPTVTTAEPIFIIADVLKPRLPVIFTTEAFMFNVPPRAAGDTIQFPVHEKAKDETAEVSSVAPAIILTL
jgi:hypothetical protein